MNTYAEINLEAIKHNIVQVKNLIPDTTKFMAVVKANAYGHGAVPVSRCAISAGADYLAVANLKEALELREAGILSPVLILTESPTSVMDEVLQHNLTQTVYSYSEAKALSDEALQRKKIGKLHLKIDTGMGRVGVGLSEAVALYTKIASLPNLEIEGVFTHFAKAEEPDDSFTKTQFDKFTGILSGIPPLKLKHAANSAATLLHPSTHLDMVRVGLMMYGLNPSFSGNRIDLKPALSFKTRVVYSKRVASGIPLSYGGAYVTRQESQIVTLPVGYADGYSRRLSNKGYVLINGRRYLISGRVSMDMVLVDVGQDKVSVGDEAVLIGEQLGQVISADEIAKLDDTISYEVVCGIGKRVTRIYR
ncbi:MAG: alanine racemase [Candidatus Saganbacteria bacterium]|nr:alanine racemase [Candidatus Saganbacteria bacterium]